MNMLHLNKTMYILLTILSILIVGLFFIYKNYQSNLSGMNLQKVTLQNINSNVAKFDGVKVELVGTYEHMFETSNIDGKIWLETSPSTTFSPQGTTLQTFTHTKVRVVGVMYTQGNYGHLGMYPFLIKADTIEMIGKGDDPTKGPAVLKEYAKQIADRIAEKVDVTGKGWKPEIINSEISSLDVYWWAISYIPIWDDGGPQRPGGGFVIQVDKYSGSTKGPMWGEQ